MRSRWSRWLPSLLLALMVGAALPGPASPATAAPLVETCDVVLAKAFCEPTATLRQECPRGAPGSPCDALIPALNEYDRTYYDLDQKLAHHMSRTRHVVPDGAQDGDWFGGSMVALDDGTVIVAAPGDDEFGTDAGALYVYEGGDIDGPIMYKIAAPTPTAFGGYGSHGLEADGNRFVVGDPNDDTRAEGAGALQLYARDESGQFVATTITATDGRPGDGLGAGRLLFSDGHIVQGVPKADSDVGVDVGAIYVFQTSGTHDIVETRIERPHTGSWNGFGTDPFDFDALRLIVIDDREKQLLVYVLNGNGTYTETTIAPMSPETWDFGRTVVIEGTTVVASAWALQEDGSIEGAVFLHDLEDDGPFDDRVILAPDGHGSYWFGRHLVLDNGTLIVANPLASITANRSGAIHVSQVADNDPLQWTTLAPSDATDRMVFGSSAPILHNGTILVPVPEHSGHVRYGGGAYLYMPEENGTYTETLILPRSAGENERAGSGGGILITDRAILGSPLHAAANGTTGAIVVHDRTPGPGAMDPSETCETPQGALLCSATEQLLAALGEGRRTARQALDAVDGQQRFETSLHNGTAFMAGLRAGATDGQGFANLQYNWHDDGSRSTSIRHYRPDGSTSFTVTDIMAPVRAGTPTIDSLSNLAMEEDLLVVGEPYGGTDEVTSGSVMVYAMDATGVRSETRLAPRNGTGVAYFGAGGIAIYNGTIVVGSLYDTETPDGGGALFLFQPDGEGGYDETKIIPANASGGSHRGMLGSLAMTGDTIYVADPWGDPEDRNRGAIHAITYDEGGVTSQQKFVPDGVPDGSFLGLSSFHLTAIAAEGDHVAVTSPSDDSAAEDAGAIYLGQRQEEGHYTFTKHVLFKAQPGDFIGWFGGLTMSEGQILLGHPLARVNGEVTGGAVLLQPIADGRFGERYVSASDGRHADLLGAGPVGLHQDRVVAFAPWYKRTTDDAGATYVFDATTASPFIGI